MRKTPHPRPFRYRIPIRFGDIDQAGVAYFPTLFDHCHTAFEEFWAGAIGVPYPRVLLEDRLGFPTAHIESDFRTPLKYGDVLTFEVTVSHLGRSSVTFRYRALLPKQREPAFDVRCTTVCVDMRTFRPIPIPPRYRRLLSPRLVP